MEFLSLHVQVIESLVAIADTVISHLSESSLRRNWSGMLLSIADVMNFDGIAPELVNGRLAMLGFLAAVGAEISSGAVWMSPALIILEPSLYVANMQCVLTYWWENNI